MTISASKNEEFSQNSLEKMLPRKNKRKISISHNLKFSITKLIAIGIVVLTQFPKIQG